MTGPGGTSEALPRLADLRDLAAPLEPSADQRRRLTDLAVEHVETFLAAAPCAPTLLPSHGVADALAAYGFPDTPRDPAEVLDVVGRLVETPGVATTSPRYLGYIPSGGLFHAALADFLAAASNRYAGQASISPGAAGLEHVVVRWMADVLGLGPDAGGVLTSGGSMGALTAVVAARDAAGILDPAGGVPVVYLTEHTHHSVPIALHVAGLAAAVVRRVPVDDRHRMDVASLAQLIRTDRGCGRRPFLVVATAGTTNTGSVDPLDAIADLAARESLWFHIDGAYGGLFALCAEGREVLAGIERADSLVVDPHKTLFLPYGTGAVMVRERRLLEGVFRTDADYLAAHPPGEPPSPADLGLELTRHFRALRLWLPLQLAGRRAFGAALSEKILLARHAHERLASVPGIEVGPPPDLSIVTFRCAATGTDDDEATARLAATLQRSGEVYLTTTRVDGRLVLRVAVGSFRTHLDDVEGVVGAVSRAVRAAPPAADLADLVSQSPVVPANGRDRARQHPARRHALRLEFLSAAPDSEILACESHVLGQRYGNTADELREAYGPYEDVTVYLAVREAAGRVLGWARMITPGSLQLKTVADASRAPWDVDVHGAAAELGIDLHRAWDVTTIGVRRELGAAGSIVAAALYHGVIRATRANGVAWILAMLDIRVRTLLDRVGLVMHPMPGAVPRPYFGSPATIPTYAHMERMVLGQRHEYPESYRRITLGLGLDGIAVPSDEAFLLMPLQTVDLRESETRMA
jgi:aromatic-L-amino-acid/L-tryptophan decarboxylase